MWTVVRTRCGLQQGIHTAGVVKDMYLWGTKILSTFKLEQSILMGYCIYKHWVPTEHISTEMKILLCLFWFSSEIQQKQHCSCIAAGLLLNCSLWWLNWFALWLGVGIVRILLIPIVLLILISGLVLYRPQHGLKIIVINHYSAIHFWHHLNTQGQSSIYLFTYLQAMISRDTDINGFTLNEV